jgi:small subunit ribosomal protein S17
MAKARTAKNGSKARDIGLEIEPPSEECEDPLCPFHGTLSVRGAVIDGTVTSARMMGSVVVQRERRVHVPKYERFKLVTHKYSAHNPACLNAKEGDKVTIAECRPLSKTKKYVVVKIHEGTGGA